jgi:oligosaccharide repeat unit polymerase
MLLSISATAVMLALGLVAKMLTRDWLHPAVIFPIYWAFACCVSILVAPENITSASGPLWILLNTILVAAGAIAGAAFACSSRSRRAMLAAAAGPDSHSIPNRWLRKATLLCILLALLYVVLWLRFEGISVASLTSLQNLARTAMKMSVERYFGAGSAPIYLQLLLTAAYLAPLFGGALYLHRQSRSDMALSLLGLFPSFACFATESTRSSVLYGATMWVAGYLSMRPYLGIRTVKLKKKALLFGVAVIPLMLLLITVWFQIAPKHTLAATSRHFLNGWITRILAKCRLPQADTP